MAEKEELVEYRITKDTLDHYELKPKDEDCKIEAIVHKDSEGKLITGVELRVLRRLEKGAWKVEMEKFLSGFEVLLLASIILDNREVYENVFVEGGDVNDISSSS